MKKRSKLFFAYLTIIIPVIIFHSGKGLNYESLSIFFVLSALILYFSRIDSRYLILNALLSLGAAPVFLFYGLDTLTEAAAIYSFYFLTAGIIMQIVDLLLPRKIVLDLNEIETAFAYLQKLGFAALAIFIVSYAWKLNSFIKAMSLYMTMLLLSPYIIKLFKNEPKKTARKR